MARGEARFASSNRCAERIIGDRFCLAAGLFSPTRFSGSLCAPPDRLARPFFRLTPVLRSTEPPERAAFAARSFAYWPY